MCAFIFHSLLSLLGISWSLSRWCVYFVFFSEFTEGPRGDKTVIGPCNFFQSVTHSGPCSSANSWSMFTGSGAKSYIPEACVFIHDVCVTFEMVAYKLPYCWKKFTNGSVWTQHTIQAKPNDCPFCYVSEEDKLDIKIWVYVADGKHMETEAWI